MNKIIKNYEINLLHMQLQKGLIYGVFLRLLNKNIKLIVGRHNTAPTQLRLHYGFFNKVFGILIDIYTAVSKSVKNRMVEKERIKKEKIKLIYNGFDVNRITKIKKNDMKIRLGFKKSDFVIGTVGTLSRQKGIDFLIKAIAKINDEQIKLLIVGDGPLKNEYIKLRDYVSSNKKIKFIGETKNIYSIYDSIDLFALTSRWEGFGLVVGEAILRNVPVLVSRVDGPIELLNNKYGYFVKVGNIDEIKKGILKIRRDYNNWKEITKKGEEFIRKNFNLNKVIKEYELLYEKIL